MASINKIQLPDGVTYDINDKRIYSIELTGTNGTLTDEQYQQLYNNYDKSNIIYRLDENNVIVLRGAAQGVFFSGLMPGEPKEYSFRMIYIADDHTWQTLEQTFSFLVLDQDNISWDNVTFAGGFAANASDSTGEPGRIEISQNHVEVTLMDQGVGLLAYYSEAGYETTLCCENSSITLDSGSITYDAVQHYFEGTVDFTHATVIGLSTDGGTIDTSDLQVEKLSLLDPGNNVAGYLACQTTYGGLQLSAKTFVPRIVPTDSINGTIGQVSSYTTQLLDGGVALNTSYSDANPDGITKLIFPTDRTTDQTFATREWVNDRQWSDSNGEPGRILISANRIELTLGDQQTGIYIIQQDGSYNTTIWGDSITLAGIISQIDMSSSGARLESDGVSLSIYDSNDLYLCSDGDNGTSYIDMYNNETLYYSTTHKFTGDITAQRSGETTASKVITAADFTYSNNILTIDLT